jgi:two-component system invasion response regulator UvrY
MKVDFLVKTMTDAHFSPVDPNFHRLRVLLVDDKPQVLHDLRQLLELTGLFDILAEARDGAQALDLAAELAPDAILMDLEMPGMDGYEATRRIKARQPAPRVVILSVHASPVERERALSAGADCFVMKGANYEELVNALLGRIDSPGTFNSKKGNNI